MLIIGRRVGERVWITDKICIQVLDINSRAYGKVRFGIEAPADVRIAREELVSLSVLRRMEKDLEAARLARRGEVNPPESEEG